MVTTGERQEIVDPAASLTDESIQFLQEMIWTRSINPPRDYEEIHSSLTETFASHGWEVETAEPPAEFLDDLGIEHRRPNDLAHVSRGDGPTIALKAHQDTVPVDEAEWSFDPFAAEIHDGRVYGRGAVDSKGRIAAYAMAARVLEDTGLVPEDANVVLAITVDEETDGEAGPGYLARSGTLRPDYAIVEGNCESVWRTAFGVNQYRVSVSEEASHAGLASDAGSNAIIGASRIVAALDRYASELTGRTSGVENFGGPTCTVGTVEGGMKTNIVPSSCVFTFDQRVHPDYDHDDLEREFRAVVDVVEIPSWTEVDIHLVIAARSYHFPADAPHMLSAKENTDAVFEWDVPAKGGRGFTDARFFAQEGSKVLN